MCKADECGHYVGLFSVAIKRRRFAVLTMLGLLVISVLVGASLLLSTVLLSGLSATQSLEFLKAGIGLAVSGVSVATAKEILDRWAALGPLEHIHFALGRCGTMETGELEAVWSSAKEIAKKL